MKQENNIEILSKKREIKMNDHVNVGYPLIKKLHKLGIKNGNEIMLFSKILGLQNNGEGCIASNDYFSGFFCLTDRQIRDYLSDLKSKGLIKTYEKKQGLKTTTRYIYVQYDILGAEDIFQSSDVPAEEIRQSSGRNTSEEWKKHVRPAEDIFHHIIEDNRIIKDNKEVAIAPDVAAAPIVSDETYKNFDFKSTSALSNERIRFVIDKKIEELKLEHNNDCDSITQSLVKCFTGAFYKCDEECIMEYANHRLSN